MLGKKGRQRGNHELPRNAGRYVHAQAPAQLTVVALEHALQFVHVVEQIAAALVERGAVGGELHAAGGAMQELGAQRGFEPLHGGGDAGLRQAQRFGGTGEAAELGNAQEGAKRVHRVHGLVAESERCNQDVAIYVMPQG